MNLMDLVVTVTADDQASGKVSSIAGGIKSSLGGIAAGLGIVTGIGAAVSAVKDFGVSVVETSMEFDKSMAGVAATLGYTTAELSDGTSQASQNMQKLEDAARGMAKTSKFTASEAAEGLNYMALAGYDADKSIAMLPNVLNLAAAGDFELATASDMVTDAQSALGLSMEETTTLVDQMAKASSTTNTSVEQLGSAMLTVGGTAKSLRGGTAEAAQVLGLLADNGIKGAEGGTALRNVLLSFSNGKFEKAFDSLGVSAYDASGELRPMKDIISDMNDVMADMTTEEKNALISKAFNARDLKSINALLGTTEDRWDEVGAAIEDCQGAAQDMANTKLDNLEGAVTIFNSQLDETRLVLAEKVTPALQTFVEAATDGLGRVTDAFQAEGLFGGYMEYGDMLREFYQSLPPVIGAPLDFIASKWQAFVQGFQAGYEEWVQPALDQLAAAWEELNTAFADLGVQFGSANDAMNGVAEGGGKGLAGVLSLLVQFVTLVVRGLTILVQGVGIAGQKFAELKAKVQPVATAFQSVVSAVQNAFNTIVNAVSGFVSAVSGGIQRAISLFTSIPSRIMGALGSVNLFNIGGSIMQGLINGISSKLGPLGALLGGITKSFPELKGPPRVDRVLLYGSGSTIMQGLIDGIESMRPALARSLGDVTDSITVNALPTVVGAAPQQPQQQQKVEYHLHIDGAQVNSSAFVEQKFYDLMVALGVDATREYGVA